MFPTVNDKRARTIVSKKLLVQQCRKYVKNGNFTGRFVQQMPTFTAYYPEHSFAIKVIVK